jgi:hypothetical protein
MDGGLVIVKEGPELPLDYVPSPENVIDFKRIYLRFI